jgi:hypothetical protein
VFSILQRLPKLPGLRILEPSAGRGAIVRELLRAGADNANLLRVEIDRARADVLLHDATPGAPEVFCADFLKLGHNFAEPAPIGGIAKGFDLVVMNPPFAAAQEHVEHAISMLAPGGCVAALLRLAFCVSAKRAAFRKAHPFDLYPLASRPSFTPDGKTDSADYAWFVFHGYLHANRNMRNAGGRFAVLEGKGT